MALAGNSSSSKRIAAYRAAAAANSENIKPREIAAAYQAMASRVWRKYLAKNSSGGVASKRGILSKSEAYAGSRRGGGIAYTAYV